MPTARNMMAGNAGDCDSSPMAITSAAEQLADAGCVYAEEEAAILVRAARTDEELQELVVRRAAGEPLEYVVGWTEFRGLQLAVDDGVFVPRPRSGFLVEEAASLVRCRTGSGRAAVVVDLCCGVGAIGAALTAEVPQVNLYAADIDPHAVACAQRNLVAWGGRVYQGDLFDALPRRLRRRTDVVVASPPYVPTDEIRLLAAEAREFESMIALDGGVEGLDLVRRIAIGARQWLAPGGCLALEMGESQIDRATPMVEDCGYVVRAVTSEEYGYAVIIGRRRAGSGVIEPSSREGR